MDEEIKITAHIDSHAQQTCRFEVDRPVYPEGSAYFGSPDLTEDSPLAAKLFELPETVSIRIAGNHVTVTKTGTEDWRSIAKKVADILRSQLNSGHPAVSPHFRAGLPPDSEMKAKVGEIFDTKINPAVANHGGVVELLDVKDGNVYVRMGGGCQGCGMASATLRQGIETLIREALPYVGEILDVTDHAAGANPYYAGPKT